MKREDLVAMGISEENIEKIMADHAKAVQSANAKTNQYKEKADKADELQSQLDELNSQGMSEVEKANKALETANNRIAELEKRDAVRTRRAKLMEKLKISAEDASKIISDDGSMDDDVLGQIFADGIKNAVAENEKQKLADTPNPGGSGSEPKKDEKPDDVKNAESITFGNVSAEQSAKDYYKL